jgi:hypothetical protein
MGMVNTITTLIIDGGLGRILTAIPALEKYVINNPNTYIVICSPPNVLFTGLLYSNKILSKNVFDWNTKGIFEKIKDTHIIKPDPYYNSDYLNGKINMMDAWNQVINNDKDVMPIPKIKLRKDELYNFSQIRKQVQGKLIAFQPFGSGLEVIDNNIRDQTHRSLTLNTTQQITQALKDEGYHVWLMIDRNIPMLQMNNFVEYYPQSSRDIAGMISQCDYFLGIDSVGQHIARFLKKPGTVIMGATNAVNASYPDYFNILNNDENRPYMPYRFNEFDWWVSQTLNDDIMDFSDKKTKKFCKKIIKHIKKTTG